MSVGAPLIKPPKITARLGNVGMSLTAGALLIAIALIGVVEYFNLRAALLEDTRVEAKVLADNVSAAVLFGDRKAAIETIQTLRASPILDVVAVLLPDSRVFVRAEPQGTVQAMPIVSLAPQSYLFSWGTLSVQLPMYHDGAIIGHIYIEKSFAQLYRQLFIYGASATAIGGTALLLVWLMLSRVQRAVAGVEKDLLAMAHIDPVTRLWNRNTFNEHLQAAIEQCDRDHRKVALVLLDLDNFKAVNDALGHHNGDSLLASAAQRLFDLLGSQDIICRLGGDEFALVLQRSHTDALPLIADSITKLFAAAFVVEGQELNVTCSVGVSVYPDDAKDMQSLVRNADSAMYQAKSSGKNSYQFFTEEMQRRLSKRTALEKHLRNAIANDELSLHFQPQFDLCDLRLIGAEALLRWRNVEFGEISPAEFIPVAEESDLIILLGDWVLNTACKQLREWQKSGFNLPQLSVNFSAKQLRSAHIAKHIISIIKENAIDPALIEIELTESVLMENVHNHIEDFNQLQRFGVKLAIDDFGTGYSSMSYLKQLPFDRIKIDRSFIQDLPHSANDREIVTAMIAMSHNLGLRVTAEGVETEQQLDFLREARCDSAQGFYLGRPMAAEQLFELLRLDR